MESARTGEVPWPAIRRDLLTALLASGLAAFSAVVLLLLARRIAGALVHPLAGFALIGVGGLGLLVTLGWRLGWQARGQRASPFELIAPVFPGIALFTLLSVLSLPGTANWALMLTWLAFLTGEAAWWWAAYSSQRPRVVNRSIPANGPQAASFSALRDDTADQEGSLPQAVFQQITRSREGEQEHIAVMLRIPFAAGQRTAVTHVAFCPPLEKIPVLAVEVADGPEATVAITNPQTFGTRLEVRLAEPAEDACEVVVEISGRAGF